MVPDASCMSRRIAWLLELFNEVDAREVACKLWRAGVAIFANCILARQPVMSTRKGKLCKAYTHRFNIVYSRAIPLGSLFIFGQAYIYIVAYDFFFPQRIDTSITFRYKNTRSSLWLVMILSSLREPSTGGIGNQTWKEIYGCFQK